MYHVPVARRLPTMRQIWTPWRMAYIRRDKRPGCIFCEMLEAADDAAQLILHRGDLAFLVLNKYPYNNGHLMAVPYRHVDTLEALTAEEAADMMALVTLGIRALRLSADYGLERQTSSDSGTGESAEGVEEPSSLGWKELAITFSVAIVFAVGLFIVIPLAVVKYFEDTFSNPFVFNLVEGLIRIAIFLAYVGLISFLPDLRRVFEYHGAEHKTIHAYEHGEPLDVEHVSRFTTRHPRCGTAFLLVVMVVAILVFSVVGKPSLLWLVVSRLVGIPLVAGLAYEVIRYAGRHQKGTFARIVSWPGLALQRLTTREPDAGEVEVAIAVLQEVLRVEAGGEPVPQGVASWRLAQESGG